jgi:hypothetical protein
MDHLSTSRRLHLTTIIMLLISVFSWGIQYKVSLYDVPARKSGRVPEAKLLSQKERPVLSASAENDLAKPTQSISFLFFALLSSLTSIQIVLVLRRLSSRDTLRVGPSRRQPNLSFFFFRPPPALIPSR